MGAHNGAVRRSRENTYHGKVRCFCRLVNKIQDTLEMTTNGIRIFIHITIFGSGLPKYATIEEGPSSGGVS